MTLWNRISGSIRVEVTAPEIEQVLDLAARRGLTLNRVSRTGVLTVSAWIPGNELKALEAVAEKKAGKTRVLEKRGLVYWFFSWRKRPVLAAVLMLLIAASVYLPGRILFVRVTGNDKVPARLILETAEEFGLSFGASRRAVRSERIKNELLGAIDALEWVGVNTSGSVATVQVRERAPEPKAEQEKYCNLVAVCDGVVDQVILVKGELKCTAGQAVRKGDILISGYLDLGLCTRMVEAEGEVYALTLRQNTVVIPTNRLVRSEKRDEVRKYSILVGKKRINLYSDSGILMPTCGKMTKINQLRLPGGFTLPLALIQETYTQYELSSLPWSSAEAESTLYDASRRSLMQGVLAGTVLVEQIRLKASEQIWKLTASYECREMIARQDEGVYLQDYG